MINGRNLFDKPIRNAITTYENIRKIATGQGAGYTPGFLLDYPQFKKIYKLIVIELSKQQALDDNPKGNQQINFKGNLDRAGYVTMLFIVEDFSQETVRVSKIIISVIINLILI